jgi:DNA-binding transcriptional LysR family regulator
MLDVNRLLLLRELELRGSLAAVARVRGISTSAVSQQLRKLESEAGARLLEHRGRILALTPAGLRLVRHADVVLDVLESAETELDAGREMVHGSVRLEGFATFARPYLPAVVESVGRRHPDVEVVYRQVEPDEALEQVAGRRSDVAIVDEFPHIPKRVDRNLERTFLQRDEIIPCLPAGTEADLDADHLDAMSELIREMEESAEALPIEPASRQLRYDLCPDCRARYLRDPLSKEGAQKFDFSDN